MEYESEEEEHHCIIYTEMKPKAGCAHTFITGKHNSLCIFPYKESTAGLSIREGEVLYDNILIL